MAPVSILLRRDASSKVTIDLTIVFLVLIIVIISSVGALWFLRRIRNKREARSLLPVHMEDDEKLSLPKKKGHRRMSGISIASTISIEKHKSRSRFVDEEKQEFLANTSPPPTRGLPQIQVTFPEEMDSAGKHQSGRVVVLHVDDKGGIGMAPVPENEKPPAYQREHFESLDLERIGGLKEKDRS